MKARLIALYLDWVNNFITVGRFAEHHKLTVGNALRVIRLGKILHQNERATLIARYENNLAKVKAMHSGGGMDAAGFKGEDYIAYAEGQLEAVKQGGMDRLKKFWATYK